jgi:hypothetical protein
MIDWKLLLPPAVGAFLGAFMAFAFYLTRDKVEARMKTWANHRNALDHLFFQFCGNFAGAIRNRDRMGILRGDSPASLRGMFREFRLPAPVPCVEVDSTDVLSLHLKKRISMNCLWAAAFNHELMFFLHSYARLHTEHFLGHLNEEELTEEMRKWQFAINVLLSDSEDMVQKTRRLLVHIELTRKKCRERSRWYFLFSAPKLADVTEEEIDEHLKSLSEAPISAEAEDLLR